MQWQKEPGGSCTVSRHNMTYFLILREIQRGQNTEIIMLNIGFMYLNVVGLHCNRINTDEHLQNTVFSQKTASLNNLPLNLTLRGI